MEACPGVPVDGCVQTSKRKKHIFSYNKNNSFSAGPIDVSAKAATLVRTSDFAARLCVLRITCQDPTSS